ncbi:hypothetical protein GCM10010299_46230 [Streptomyces tanashiensis]|nr:hypothetical protein GCM10010299_46230 [Streptomyces tanashiensis]
MTTLIFILRAFYRMHDGLREHTCAEDDKRGVNDLLTRRIGIRPTRRLHNETQAHARSWTLLTAHWRAPPADVRKSQNSNLIGSKPNRCYVSASAAADAP